MSSQPNQTTNFTTFADWCLHFDSLTEAAKHTVEVLLKYANTSDCYEADRILSNLTWLNLNYNQIADISPLIALTNLTWLNLNYNQIADISPLIALTNLTWLDLNYNQIA
ncbi:MAG TPA: leucine-rich repeat domain-containing protein, partial [Cyanobacteria bacterium UBA11372]|nr:leucine-rich repeat domain-containing protein [Cyanobacteria bacterium UBA11372]